jgi:RNA-binding protein|tara:strand:+ start:868 stop:1155 length:288 start_codon:yes stop_codon:yes gene_type:complete
MSLTVKETVRLRGEAMRLKPILKIGKNGLSETVVLELTKLLKQHKLIKVRIEQNDRKERQAFAQTVAKELGAEFIGLTGKALVLYSETPTETPTE